jgi:putative transposase
LVLLLTKGQMSDHKGARLLLPARRPRASPSPTAVTSSNRPLAALAAKGIEPCVPSTRRRKAELPYDKVLYRQRRRVEITFGRLKDWRHIATRYDRCATTFFGAITPAAIVTCWLG